MQYCGELSAAQQGSVVIVEIVGDERRWGSSCLAEGFDDRQVPAADRVDGVDVRFLVQRVGYRAQGSGVETVGVGHLDDPPVWRELSQYGAESDLPLLTRRGSWCWTRR